MPSLDSSFEKPKPKVIYVASSLGRGLKFHFAHLAIALHKRLPSLIVVSGPKEQEVGLFRRLKRNRIRIFIDRCVDDLSLRNFVKGIVFFRQLIINEKIDIMHVQSIYCLFMVFLSSKALFTKRKMKILCTIHGFLQERRFQKVGLFFGSLFLNLCADLVIPVAEDTAKKLIKCGLLKSKVEVVHNGINLRLFDEITAEQKTLSSMHPNIKDPSNIIVSYCANLIPRKGHKYLIMALSRILREYPNIKVILTSDGPLKEKLIDLARDLGNLENVYFTGRVSYRELYRLLAMTDIYVFPSLSESFPFAILEAMAAGKPIVSTDVGGIPEVIGDGHTGILVPPKDSTGLAEAIVELIENPTRAREMGKNCRTLVERRYSIHEIADNLTRYYEIPLARG